MTTVILVWYFLSAENHNIATQGPFASKVQCEQLSDWARKTTWARYTSDCYSAPLAAPQRPHDCFNSDGWSPSGVNTMAEAKREAVRGAML